MQLKLFELNDIEITHETAFSAKMPRTVRKISYRKRGVPRLVIEGKWLLKLGINIGDTVKLEYLSDRIVILFENK